MGSSILVGTPGSRTAPSVYLCGDVEVDCGERVARVAGDRRLLTFGEFEILVGLVKSRGRVLTRDELHHHIRQGAVTSLRSVDTHVARLRRKLIGAQHFQIETVQRVGYRCHWSASSDRMLGESPVATRHQDGRRSVSAEEG